MRFTPDEGVNTMDESPCMVRRAWCRDTLKPPWELQFVQSDSPVASMLAW